MASISSLSNKFSSYHLFPKTTTHMQDLYPFIHTLHPQYSHFIPQFDELYKSHLLQGPTKLDVKDYCTSSLISPSSVLSNRSDDRVLHCKSSTTEADQKHASVNQAVETKASIAAQADKNHVYIAGKKRSRALFNSKETHDGCKLKRTTSGESELTSDDGNNADKERRSDALSNKEKKKTKEIPEQRKNLRNIKENSSNITKESAGPSNQKPDFIHVRARRGQATDSHSLAERVRREKISERMKYLQELVPGCVKVTGKAMMLDEIINYVQSLQRQVEFLSMKLAAVPPNELEFNLQNLLGTTREVVQRINMIRDDHTRSVNDHAAIVPILAGADEDRGTAAEDIWGYTALPLINHENFCGRLPLIGREVDIPTLEAAVNYLQPCSSTAVHANMANSMGWDVASCLMAERSSRSCSNNESCLLPQNNMEYWDDDLQNIAQQMGFLAQTPAHSVQAKTAL